jgi:microcystin-dependent protein
MSNPFLGEIRLVGFNFAPRGWAMCDGQNLAIAQNDALFALLGTTYGGDGVNTFALPDLRSRVPVHMGQGPGLSSYVLGEQSGTESVALNSLQLPLHAHAVASVAGGTGSTASSDLPASGGPDLYARTAGGAPSMSAMPAGGNQPHDNMAPFVVMNFVIALNGVFPSSN